MTFGNPRSPGRRRAVARSAAGILVCALGAACEAAPRGDARPAAAPSSPEGRTAAPSPALAGRILYQARVDGRWQIHLLDLASGRRNRVADSPGDDTYPNFSPDGAWIVFSSTRGGAPGVWRMRADGGDAERLAAGCGDPCWSPDGAAVAYDCDRGGPLQVFSLDLASRRERQLTDSRWKSALPSWSPDGGAIAFARSRLGWDLFRMRVDGSEVRQITRVGGNCRPDWSPDGRRIAYVSDEGDGKGDVWTIGPDGGNRVRVTTDAAAYDYDPAWSPDGSWIVYMSSASKEGPWALHAIPAGGGTPVRLSPPGVDERYPDWAP